MSKVNFFRHVAYTHFLSLKDVFMIKKLTQALLALTLVGGMTACDKTLKGVDEGTTSATGDTYISVAFSTANPNSPRAAVKEDGSFNSIGEYIGRDKIEDVNIYMINTRDESIEVKKFDNTDNFDTNPDGNTNTRDYRTEAWKTTPGEKLIYVYTNIAGTAIETALDGAHDKASFEAANKVAYALVENGAVKADYAKFDGTNDIIAMNTVAPETLNVVAGVKKEEAEAATGAKNRTKVTVRRLVAQAAVTSTAPTYEIKETYKGAETTLASLGDFKWDVMQYEQKTFLMPQPTADGKDALKVDGCKSPSFDFLPSDDNYTTGAGNATDKYAYRAFNGEEVKTFTRSTKTGTEKNKEDVTNIVKNPMKFITETTHQFGGKLAKDGGTSPFTGYRKGNTTYVIVSAKITPKNWGEGQEDKAGDDLYFGVKDHKFYKELEAAKAANKVATVPEFDAPNTPDNVIKYAGGLCYYVAWLNPDAPAEPVKSPILRNNIYHVNITAMKKLGYSGNPFNPNGDDPKDPDDPTPDPKETLYPVDTYMAVEISVVNWGVHSFDQDF